MSERTEQGPKSFNALLQLPQFHPYEDMWTSVQTQQASRDTAEELKFPGQVTGLNSTPGLWTARPKSHILLLLYLCLNINRFP